jgi:hypothetical protein
LSTSFAPSSIFFLKKIFAKARAAFVDHRAFLQRLSLPTRRLEVSPKPTYSLTMDGAMDAYWQAPVIAR